MPSSNQSKFSNFCVEHICGKTKSKIKPVFNQNSTTVLQAIGKVCNEYIVSTGQHSKELVTCDHNIVALNSASNLWLFTENGTLLQYEGETNQLTKLLSCKPNAELLNKLNVIQFTSIDCKNGPKDDWNKHISNIKFTSAVIKENFVLASWSIPEEHYAHASLFKINIEDPLPVIVYPSDPLPKNQRCLAVGSDFVVLLSKKSAFVSKLYEKNGRSHLIGSHQFSEVAAHPTEPIFATGDTSGKIVVFRNIYEKSPLREVLHWHTLPVHSLMFTHCGSHLLSGGDECVLVKWSLGSRSKTFLPRLSSSIEHISGSADNSHVSVSTSDGKIVIINLNLACLSTIQQFSGWNSDRTAVMPILTQDPRTGALVLSGRTGHLQFISTVNHGQFLYTLDVTQKNYVTRDSESNPHNADVTFAKFTPCGKWLVTVQIECDQEARLKVWWLNEVTQEWALNTDVFMPHGPGGLHTLQVNHRELLLTTGPDNMFRLWGLQEITHLNKTRSFWGQLGCDSYRQLPSGVADFSRDGSLFAVSFGPALTLWDTENVSLKCSLTPPLQRSPLIDTRFGNGRDSHLIVTATVSDLTCWNIVTLCRQWVVCLDKVELLISDPSSTYMAAISGNQHLFVFELSSPEPNLSMEKVSEQPLVAGVFVAKSEIPQLYLLTKDQDVLSVGGSISKFIEATSISGPTPYSAQLALVSRKDSERSTGVIRVVGSDNDQGRSILDGAAHALPHVASLTDIALLSMLQKVKLNINPNNATTGETLSHITKSRPQQLTVTRDVELLKIVNNMFNNKGLK